MTKSMVAAVICYIEVVLLPREIAGVSRELTLSAVSLCAMVELNWYGPLLAGDTCHFLSSPKSTEAEHTHKNRGKDTPVELRKS